MGWIAGKVDEAYLGHVVRVVMVAIAGVLAAVVVAGCGRDSGSGHAASASASTQSTATQIAAVDDEAQIKDTLIASARAFIKGDGVRACAAYTDRGKDQLVAAANGDTTGIGAKGATCESVSRDLAERLANGTNGAFQNGGDPRVENVEIANDTAKALFIDDAGPRPFTEKIDLVRQDGKWLIDRRTFTGYDG